MRDDILVIGSGVTGLTTAILLAEAGNPVLIRTSEPAATTTSVVAGALLGPVIDDEDDERVIDWLAHADGVFRTLAEDPSTGVRIVRGRLVGHGSELPGWAARVPGFAACTGTDLLPALGPTFWAELPIADMRRYLPYLVERFARAGGRIERGTVTALAAAAAEFRTVVNCTGVLAGQLTDDADLHPVRGQHVIVENPGLTEFLYEGGPSGSRWTSYFPQGDRVVLGGLSQPGVWDRSPDPEVTADILRRTAAAEPRLAGARVLGVEVGLRPKRSTLRLEVELIGGSRVVHHYGHGGNGVQWSWGSARDAAGLALTGGA